MGKKLGVDNYQYESVDDWPSIVIPGIASDAAVDSEDRVYVATRTKQSFDYYTGAILVFNRDGKFLKAFGGDKLRVPHHIWISEEDEIYLADSFDHVVRKYNTDGELIQILGTPSQPGLPGQPFNQPTAAVLSPKSGDIYVSDGYRQTRTHRFSTDGELKTSWGSGEWREYDFAIFGHDPVPGTGPGEFKLPHGITVDSNDRVYVMDRENHRIQLFDADGQYESEWAIRSPNKAVIDENNVMHSASGGQVWLTTLDGEHMGSWGQRGSEPWEFTGGAHGLSIDSRGDVYVAQVGVENGLNKYARS